MISASDIKDHMEVRSADGQHIGTVDYLEGSENIKLTKSDSRRRTSPSHPCLNPRRASNLCCRSPSRGVGPERPAFYMDETTQVSRFCDLVSRKRAWRHTF